MNWTTTVRGIRAFDRWTAGLVVGGTEQTRWLVVASDVATRAEMAVAAISVAIAVARARPAQAGRLCLSLALTLGAVHVLSSRFRRRRPFGRDEFARSTSIDHEPDRSFPSRHAACASAITFSVGGRYRAVAAGLGAVITLSRVGAGLHFPTDVAVGWAVGAICARCATIVAGK